MNTIITDTANLFYLDPSPGNQPAVILLHGLGTEASSWTYQISALQKAGYRPIVPDLPGFGHSTYRGKRWSIKETAGIIPLLADRLNIDRFHLVGISMGGTVALQTVIDFPERLYSLVLINTFATLQPKRWNEWIYLLGRYFRASFRGAGSQAEMTARRIFPKPEQDDLRRELVTTIRQTDPQVYKTAMRELGFYDVRKTLNRIRTPALIITSENDTTVPLENQADLARGIASSRQVFIPNAGHGVIIDQPDMVNQNLLQFLHQHSI